jgi:hypothetical protein
VAPFPHKDDHTLSIFGEEERDKENENSQQDDTSDEEHSGMPIDGYFANEDDMGKHVTLTNEQKLICTPILRGYSLKEKLWLKFFVNCIKDIEWQTNAFDRLV